MAQVSFQDAGGRLYGEMQKCIIYIQNHPDQDITMEDLAGRMAYAPIQLSYLFDLFFEKSLEEWDIEKIRAYQGKGKIPYERVIDKENTEICFVRRREQKIVAESILSETEKSQKGSFLEEPVQKRECCSGGMTVNIGFTFFQEESSQRTKEKKEGKEKHLKWYWRLRIMLYLPGKKISQEERQKAC